MNIQYCIHLKVVAVIALVLACGVMPAFAGNSVTGSHAVVAGGDLNTASGIYSAVGGGGQNTASVNSSTVAGGFGSKATGGNSTVGGGEENMASGFGATIAGGRDNHSMGYLSSIPGGIENQAGGDYSFAAGNHARIRSAAENTDPNQKGDYGTFMWADSTTIVDPNAICTFCPYTYTPEFNSSGPNQFLIRANGGFALNATPVNSNVAMTVVAPNGNPGYASIFLRQSNSDNGMLVSSGDASIGIANAANNAAFYVDQYNGSGHTRRLSLDGLGNFAVTAQAYKPGGGSWAASSDARLKTNVLPLENALDRLLALRGVTFEYSHPDNGMHPVGTFTGFIAQEVEPAFPNWIGHDQNGYLTVGPQGFEALTVEALRALNNKDEIHASEYERRVTKLETENAELRDQLARQSMLQQTSVAELRQQIGQLSALLNVRSTRATSSAGE